METKEFHLYECIHGAPLELTKGFRWSRRMSSQLETIALVEGIDASTVIRHAIWEFLEQRGLDCHVEKKKRTQLSDQTSEFREDSTRP